jgi:rod shape-determining protein MreC
VAATRPRTSSRRLLLVVLLLAAVTVLTIDYRGAGSSALSGLRSSARDLFDPAVSAINRAFRPVVNFFEGAARYGKLKAENARLQQEITKLEAEAKGGAVWANELAQVSALQHLPWAANLPRVTAAVIGAAPSSFEQAIVIAKGSREGIKDGMSVVSGTGLVGQVISTAANTSVVRLLTDPNFAVAVSIGRKGVVGVEVGEGANASPKVDYVLPGSPVKRGAFVQTTQVQGGVFPPGIPVGTVSSVESQTGALQENITIHPFVDLGNLAFVAVLKWLPPPGH